MSASCEPTHIDVAIVASQLLVYCSEPTYVHEKVKYCRVLSTSCIFYSKNLIKKLVPTYLIARLPLHNQFVDL